MTKNDKDGKDHVKKFMFDMNDFDKKPEPDHPPAPVFSEDQLALAKSQAYAQGKTDGLAEARHAQEELLIKMVQGVSGKLDTMTRDCDRREIESMISAIKLSMRIAHKLLPQFAEKNGLAEIERVILSSIEGRKDEPRIAITVSPQHLEPLKSRVDVLAREKGYAGKIVLLADETLHDNDVRVEWADGGAERLFDHIYNEIEKEFVKTITTMQHAQHDGAVKETEE
jgi:flagellar assembly protein FliH